MPTCGGPGTRMMNPKGLPQTNGRERAFRPSARATTRQPVRPGTRPDVRVLACANLIRGRLVLVLCSCGGTTVSSPPCYWGSHFQVHTNIFVAVQDCANLGRVPFARRPTGTGHQAPAWTVRRLAQSAPVGVLSSALVVSKALHLSPKIPAAPPHTTGLTNGRFRDIKKSEISDIKSHIPNRITDPLSLKQHPQEKRVRGTYAKQAG